MVMLEVARIQRAHGLGGEVLVHLISDRTERLDPDSELIGADRTFRVSSSRPHLKGWLVRFNGVDRREEAEALRGIVLHAEAEDDPDPDADGGSDELWVHQIIGLEVVDLVGSRHGPVVAIQANPAHDLLVLEDGTLVPSVFIVDVADAVIIDPPEGLMP